MVRCSKELPEDSKNLPGHGKIRSGHGKHIHRHTHSLTCQDWGLSRHRTMLPMYGELSLDMANVFSKHDNIIAGQGKRLSSPDNNLRYIMSHWT
jgi:hypothetical protein